MNIDINNSNLECFIKTFWVKHTHTKEIHHSYQSHLHSIPAHPNASRKVIYFGENNNQNRCVLNEATHVSCMKLPHSPDHIHLSRCRLYENKHLRLYSVRTCCCSHFRMFHSYRLLITIASLLCLSKKEVDLFRRGL